MRGVIIRIEDNSAMSAMSDSLTSVFNVLIPHNTDLKTWFEENYLRISADSQIPLQIAEVNKDNVAVPVELTNATIYFIKAVYTIYKDDFRHTVKPYKPHEIFEVYIKNGIINSVIAVEYGLPDDGSDTVSIDNTYVLITGDGVYPGE